MLNNGVSVRSHKEARNTLIKARQYRLNHKPFTYHITVNSDRDTKGLVRIFLGPKQDEFGHEVDLMNNYMNFMQMDEFLVDCTYLYIYILLYSILLHYVYYIHITFTLYNLYR